MTLSTCQRKAKKMLSRILLCPASSLLGSAVLAAYSSPDHSLTVWHGPCLHPTLSALTLFHPGAEASGPVDPPLPSLSSGLVSSSQWPLLTNVDRENGILKSLVRKVWIQQGYGNWEGPFILTQIHRKLGVIFDFEPGTPLQHTKSVRWKREDGVSEPGFNSYQLCVVP